MTHFGGGSQGHGAVSAGEVLARARFAPWDVFGFVGTVKPWEK